MDFYALVKKYEEVRLRNEEEQQVKQRETNDMKDELKSINAFKRVRHEIQEEVENLRFTLEEGRHHHLIALEEIESDKVLRMEKMRKDMLLRVKEVKTQMLNMTEDKLQGVSL